MKWGVDGIKLDGCYMSRMTFDTVSDSYAQVTAEKLKKRE
jgi:hypothetical protein